MKKVHDWLTEEDAIGSGETVLHIVVVIESIE